MYPNFEQELKIFTQDVLSQVDTVPMLAFKALPSLLKSSFELKKHIKDSLGLNEEYRRELVIDSYDVLLEAPEFKLLQRTLDYAINRVEHSPEIKNRESVINILSLGRRENARLKQYLGKNILDYLTTNLIAPGGKNEQSFTRWLNNQLKPDDLSRAVSALAGTSYSNEKVTTSVEILLSTLRENCKSATRRLLITANPLDILLSANCSGFRSCHALDGEYSTGNMGHVMTPFSFMVGVLDEKPATYPFFKLARIFGYMDMARPGERFILSKPYGYLSQEQITSITNFLATTLSEYHKLPFEKYMCITPGQEYNMGLVGQKGAGFGRQPHPVYFDPMISRLVFQHTPEVEKEIQAQTRQNGRNQPGVTEEYAAGSFLVEFERAHCPQCGNIHNTYRGFVCGNCQREATYCNRDGCSRFVSKGNPNTYELNGRLYCRSCYNHYAFTCIGCDKLFMKNGGGYVNFYSKEPAVKQASAEEVIPKQNYRVTYTSTQEARPAGRAMPAGMPAVGANPRAKLHEVFACRDCAKKIGSDCYLCGSRELNSQMYVAKDIDFKQCVTCYETDPYMHSCGTCKDHFYRVTPNLNPNGQLLSFSCMEHVHSEVQEAEAPIEVPQTELIEEMVAAE